MKGSGEFDASHAQAEMSSVIEELKAGSRQCQQNLGEDNFQDHRQ